MGYLYDKTTRRLEKDFAPTLIDQPSIYEMAAVDDPRAKQATDKHFGIVSLVEEIRRSGFIDQLYKN